MNPFILSSNERLAHWKQFRKDLCTFSEEEQLIAVAKYWSLAPLSKMSHDMEQPNNCPSPWEMVTDGDWCRNSVAMGMEFTLRLAGWDPNRIQLLMIRDWDISEVIMVVNIDDSKVLNYTYGTVVDYPDTRHDVIGRWRFCGKLYRHVL